MNKVKKAVSLILKVNDDIFYIKRQNFLKAFPGYTAFPGGKVDLEDKVDSLEGTLKNALFREAKEELGINIEELLKNDSSSIRMIAKATSPPFNPLRFETYFFKVELIEKVHFDVDENEVFEYGWSHPSHLLEDYNKGNRLMVPPIRKVIEILIGEKKIDFVDFDIDRDYSLPMIEPLKNFLQIMPLSNTIKPATRTNAFLIGDNKKILIDPSPKNKDELEKLVKKLKEYEIEKIFITHHHKDHHQYATHIAQEFQLPIYISKDSFSRISKIYGENYFSDIKVFFLKEGDLLGKWLGEDLLVYEIPGHDEGHLGLAPISLKWFLVGDLFQGIGTVVVGGDEGDMKKYMASLEKVIKLNPACVFPSHGIGLGGTNILNRTLQHRKLREEQVFELTKKGHSIEEILKIIYFDIPDEVLKYARANIQSHLNKLIQDGRI